VLCASDPDQKAKGELRMSIGTAPAIVEAAPPSTILRDAEESAIIAVWNEGKRHNKEFGRLCYAYGEKYGAQGSAGNGLAQFLRKSNINEGIAYYWINEFKASTGLGIPCPDCTETFPSKTKLKKHQHKVHPESPIATESVQIETSDAEVQEPSTPIYAIKNDRLTAVGRKLLQEAGLVTAEERDEKELKAVVHRLESITHAAQQIANRPQDKELPSYATAVALCKQLGDVIEPAAKPEQTQTIVELKEGMLIRWNGVVYEVGEEKELAIEVSSGIDDDADPDAGRDTLTITAMETFIAPKPGVEPVDSPINYVPNFLSKKESSDLFTACEGLTFKRKTTRGGIARHATVAFSSVVDNHQKTTSLDDAPEVIKRLAARLSDHAQTDINYLAVVRYSDGDDYFDWHQHEGDKELRDQRVFIVSCGAERPFSVRPVGGRRTDITATQGSLIVLPHEFNTTYEHAVLKSKECGVRYAVNAKHIPVAKVEPTPVAPPMKKINCDLLDDVSAGDTLTIAHWKPENVENPVRAVKVTSTRRDKHSGGPIIFAKDDIARYRFTHGYCSGWYITAVEPKTTKATRKCVTEGCENLAIAKNDYPLCESCAVRVIAKSEKNRARKLAGPRIHNGLCGSEAYGPRAEDVTCKRCLAIAKRQAKEPDFLPAWMKRLSEPAVEGGVR